jgi:hypothetical protein
VPAPCNTRFDAVLIRLRKHGLVPRQGLLRADCIARSRTDYYTSNISLFVLPMAIVLYIAAIRGLLWVLRPAALFVMPQLAGHAFFDHAVHERTNALSFDVSHTQFPRGGMFAISSCKLVDVQARVCCRSLSG